MSNEIEEDWRQFFEANEEKEVEFDMWLKNCIKDAQTKLKLSSGQICFNLMYNAMRELMKIKFRIK